VYAKVYGVRTFTTLPVIEITEGTVELLNEHELKVFTKIRACPEITEYSMTFQIRVCVLDILERNLVQQGRHWEDIEKMEPNEERKCTFNLRVRRKAWDTHFAL